CIHGIAEKHRVEVIDVEVPAGQSKASQSELASHILLSGPGSAVNDSLAGQIGGKTSYHSSWRNCLRERYSAGNRRGIESEHQQVAFRRLIGCEFKRLAVSCGAISVTPETDSHLNPARHLVHCVRARFGRRVCGKRSGVVVVENPATDVPGAVGIENPPRRIRSVLRSSAGCKYIAAFRKACRRERISCRGAEHLASEERVLVDFDEVQVGAVQYIERIFL